MARIDKIRYSIQADRENDHADNEHLPAGPLKAFVENQISDGRYSTVSEYIRELIRDDEKRKAQERLEAMLLEGLAGQSTEMTPKDWDDIRGEALSLLKARNGNRS